MTLTTLGFTNEARWFRNFYENLLRRHWPEAIIRSGAPTINDPPTMLFASIFNDSEQQMFRNRSRIVLICGEPNDLKKYDFASLIIDCKNVPGLRPPKVPFVYVPFYVTSFGERFRNSPSDLILSPNMDIDSVFTQKSKFCAFMYSQEVNFRNAFYDTLSMYKQVDSLGKCRSSKNLNETDRHVYEIGNQTYNDLAVQKYISYKFVICIENSRHPGYITEKLINAKLANAVPLYFGAPDVDEHFNPRSFIDISKFNNFMDAVNYIKQVDSNNELYKSYLKEPLFKDNNLPGYFDGKYIVDEIRKLSRIKEAKTWGSLKSLVNQGMRKNYKIYKVTYQTNLRRQFHSKDPKRNMSNINKRPRFQFFKRTSIKLKFRSNQKKTFIRPSRSRFTNQF